MMKKAILLMISLLLYSSMTFAQPSSEKWSTSFDKLVSAYHELGYFNGTVLVAKRDEVLFTKSYGFSNIEKQQKNTIDTPYRINSITKQFTAAAILKLSEEGRLNLDDKVCTYLDSFCQDYPTLLIRQLLNHTSGLPDLGNKMTEQESRTEFTAERIVSLLHALKPDFAPGQGARYTTSGFWLAGMIIHKITGMPAEDYVQKNIIQVAKMENTAFFSAPSQAAAFATGYRWDAAEENLEAPAPEHPSILGLGWGMYSTVADLYQWNKVLWQGNLLSKDSLESMLTPAMPGKPYALGIMVQQLNDKKVYCHDGGSSGFSAELHYYPQDSLHIVVLANIKSDVFVKKIAESLSAIFFNKPYDLPQTYLPLPVDEPFMQPYLGRYDASQLGKPGDEALIRMKNGCIYLDQPGELPVRLNYEGYGLFGYRFNKNYKIRFRLDSSGAASHLEIVLENGQVYSIPKKGDAIID